MEKFLNHSLCGVKCLNCLWRFWGHLFLTNLFRQSYFYRLYKSKKTAPGAFINAWSYSASDFPEQKIRATCLLPSCLLTSSLFPLSHPLSHFPSPPFLHPPLPSLLWSNDTSLKHTAFSQSIKNGENSLMMISISTHFYRSGYSRILKNVIVQLKLRWFSGD